MKDTLPYSLIITQTKKSDFNKRTKLTAIRVNTNMGDAIFKNCANADYDCIC